MDVSSYLEWPFFTPEHGELVRRVDAWATAYFADRKTRRTATLWIMPAGSSLASWGGRGGHGIRCQVRTRHSGGCAHRGSALARVWLDAPRRSSRRPPAFDVRSLALIRETLACHDALADFAFAMQGLGSGAISLAGSPDDQSSAICRAWPSGEAIAAFALSEATAGSDVAAIKCRARREGDSYVLDGEKTWISNGGIAEFYCVFARTS